MVNQLRKLRLPLEMRTFSRVSGRESGSQSKMEQLKRQDGCQEAPTN